MFYQLHRFFIALRLYDLTVREQFPAQIYMGGPGNDCDLLPGSLEIACGILGHSPLYRRLLVDHHRHSDGQIGLRQSHPQRPVQRPAVGGDYHIDLPVLQLLCQLIIVGGLSGKDDIYAEGGCDAFRQFHIRPRHISFSVFLIKSQQIISGNPRHQNTPLFYLFYSTGCCPPAVVLPAVSIFRLRRNRLLFCLLCQFLRFHRLGSGSHDK